MVIPSWYPAFEGDILGSFFREQAIALKESGLQVGVIDIQFRSIKNWRVLLGLSGGMSQVDDEGLNTYRYRGANWLAKWQGMHRRLWIRRGTKLVDDYIKNNGKPDIIHAHSIFNGGLLASHVSRLYNIPFVVTEHSTAYSLGMVQGNNLNLAKTVSNQAVRRFAVSREFCELLQDQIGGAQKEWEEMPNTLGRAYVTNEPRSRSIRPRHFRFLTVALLTPKKAANILLDAFHMAYKGNHGVNLRIVGDGEELGRLKEQTVRLGINHQVEFLGQMAQDQVRREIDNSDAFVLSSLHETFGVVVVEALSMGKPVIATRCGGPESIVRTEYWLLVEKNNVESLAEAMKKM
jgi:glycosyltransferase involved in cell wall biosynthesis